MRRLTLLAMLGALLSTSCAFLGGPGQKEYRAVFERAIQVFPGGRVRVLGVDVGAIASVENVEEGVEVTFLMDEDTPLPVDVEAAIVPVSLLGERYIQLFPAYTGGPVLPRGSTIPLSRTAIPSEPDELLRSLQDYLGALDPRNVGAFVENTAAVLQGNGEDLNDLIRQGAGVIETLAQKRDDLAGIITGFERVSRVVSDRRDEVDRLIETYNAVVGTLTANRTALEGSVIGLKDMSTELAALLLTHRAPLHEDIEALTRTGRTLVRNAETFARTGHWAQRLFSAASRAVDFEKDWLQLNGQEQELEFLIFERLQERLTGLCRDLEIPSCAAAAFWEARAPSLFCRDRACEASASENRRGDPSKDLADAIGDVPELAEKIAGRSARAICAEAPDPERCLRERRILRQCLDAADPASCLRRHDLPSRCLEAANPTRCLRRAQERELRDAVGAFVDRAVGGLR